MLPKPRIGNLTPKSRAQSPILVVKAPFLHEAPRQSPLPKAALLGAKTLKAPKPFTQSPRTFGAPKVARQGILDFYGLVRPPPLSLLWASCFWLFVEV